MQHFIHYNRRNGINRHNDEELGIGEIGSQGQPNLLNCSLSKLRSQGHIDLKQIKPDHQDPVKEHQLSNIDIFRIKGKWNLHAWHHCMDTHGQNIGKKDQVRQYDGRIEPEEDTGIVGHF